jgi:hypothetical protein
MLTLAVAEPHANSTEDPHFRAAESDHQLCYSRYDATHQLTDDAVIGVGLGHASITRDGVTVFEENGQDPDDLPTAADAERMAREAPHPDWRIHLVSLREERHYRREGEGRWVLYRRGYGLS